MKKYLSLVLFQGSMQELWCQSSAPWESCRWIHFDRFCDYEWFHSTGMQMTKCSFQQGKVQFSLAAAAVVVAAAVAVFCGCCSCCCYCGCCCCGCYCFAAASAAAAVVVALAVALPIQQKLEPKKDEQKLAIIKILLWGRGGRIAS